MHARRRAVGLLLLTAGLWSTGGVLIKGIAWHPLAIAGVRSAIAAAFLFVVLRRPAFVWSWSQIGGASAYAASVILFVLATKFTTAAQAIFLLYTSPLYVAFLSAWLLREPVRGRDWLTLGAVGSGLALFLLEGLTIAGRWGQVCGLLSGIAAAGMVLCLRYQRDTSLLETILLGNIMAAGVGVPFAVFGVEGVTNWLAIVFAGTVQIGLTFVFYTRALPHVRAIEAVMIPVVEPILNPIWVVLFTGETPGKWALVGGVIVISAITLRSLSLAFGEEALTPGTDPIADDLPV